SAPLLRRIHAACAGGRLPHRSPRNPRRLGRRRARLSARRPFMSSEDRGSKIEDRKSVDPVQRPSILEPQSSILDHSSASPVRAWFYLIWLSMQRQARVWQMIWIALGLLLLTATVIALTTAQGRWSMRHYRWTWVNPDYYHWELKYRKKEIPH